LPTATIVGNYEKSRLGQTLLQPATCPIRACPLN
jgi:hypothetical protein